MSTDQKREDRKLALPTVDWLGESNPDKFLPTCLLRCRNSALWC